METAFNDAPHTIYKAIKFGIIIQTQQLIIAVVTKSSILHPILRNSSSSPWGVCRQQLNYPSHFHLSYSNTAFRRSMIFSKRTFRPTDIALSKFRPSSYYLFHITPLLHKL